MFATFCYFFVTASANCIEDCYSFLVRRLKSSVRDGYCRRRAVSDTCMVYSVMFSTVPRSNIYVALAGSALNVFRLLSTGHTCFKCCVDVLHYLSMYCVVYMV